MYEFWFNFNWINEVFEFVCDHVGFGFALVYIAGIAFAFAVVGIDIRNALDRNDDKTTEAEE